MSQLNRTVQDIISYNQAARHENGWDNCWIGSKREPTRVQNINLIILLSHY